MKTFTVIVIIVIVATVVHAGPQEELKKIADKCKTAVHATDADVKVAMVLGIPSTKPGQCLLACMHKKTGWMNADNTINTDVVKKSFEPTKSRMPKFYEKVIQKLKTCKAQEKKEADECLAAKNFSECWNSPKKN